MMKGVESLVKEEAISASELTMLDWYAAFAMMAFVGKLDYQELPQSSFNLAEEMMKERKKRL